MQQITTLQYNDQFSVGFTNDVWFNATAVAKNFGKLPNEWLRLESTQEYIQKLTNFLLRENPAIKSEEFSLQKTQRGRHGSGTWFHPKLAVAFARWLDVDFAIWCDMQVDKLLYPKSSTLRESFTCPFANQQQSAPVALSPEFVTPAQAKMVEHIVADIQQYVHFEKSASWNVYASIRELYKVESFAKLPAKHFDAVIHSLNEKLELAKKHHYLLCKADQVFIKNVLKKSSLQLNAPLQYGLLA